MDFYLKLGRKFNKGVESLFGSTQQLKFMLGVFGLVTGLTFMSKQISGALDEKQEKMRKDDLEFLEQLKHRRAFVDIVK